ncbi:MAG: 3-phosphoshikimate 1-carboxyvinyltransferase, partial [Dehalococcoidia bacterium]|nr:3-phosphoshikimate 1-carboxyvinyltransferase [Dehalococcoidia bacterium]
MERTVHGSERLEATVIPPGDKSISHRAALLNAISDGQARVANFCVGDDRTSMLGCLRGLGVEISESVEEGIETFTIRGRGLDGLTEPSDYLYSGNSGTTMRLVSGLLAAQSFFSVITGDSSLRGRPMKRILTPLSMMGAQVMGRGGGSLAPLAFDGGDLHGIEYEMPVASAQLKSCILIAGLFAEGETSVIQPAESRDHTERMMASMGADVEQEGMRLTVRPPSRLASLDIQVPCDISGAAFWLVAGAAHPNARITVQGVGINPSRTGVLDVLREMGANIRMENVQEEGNEPSADLVVESSDLRGVEISGDIIPRVIDELPVLAVAASQATGQTIIRDAAELRVKESDRISATAIGLN